MISLPGPMHDVTSNKTIVGLGANSGLTGGGLNVGLPLDDDIVSPPANAVKNVIIRNINITNCPDDCINVQMFSHHIWIDHNDLSNQVDGALDVKRGSSYVTISWNRFHNSDKNIAARPRRLQRRAGHRPAEGHATTTTSSTAALSATRGSASASRCTSTTTTSCTSPATASPRR